MKQSNKELIINHKAIDLYKIVLNIKEYPEYIPWCKEIQILNKKNNKITANMIVEYKLLPSQTFTSNVYFNSKKLIIKTDYTEGPLKNLKTIWNFINISNKKSKVLFNLEFEFENFFHQKLAELFYPLIEDKMINSFIIRADRILN